MQTILLKNRTLYFNLLLSIGFALAVLFFRARITHSFYYFFLVWNLFLAGVPFLISQTLKNSIRIRNSKILGGLSFVAWLLFLPNSPYIITDLLHLHDRASHLLWLDLFLVFVFALNGLVLGLLSLVDMSRVLTERFDKTVAAYTLFKVCLLSGFGIYMGRFLRFNSWDVLTKPKSVFFETIYHLREPKAWLITFAFGGFLLILFLLLNYINEIRFEKP
jgi:uncharacterized membrane protein